MKQMLLSGLAYLEAQFWPSVPTRDCSVEFEPDEDGVQVRSALDARGRELPDPTPMAPPVGYRDGPSLADFVQRMIRQEVSRIAAEAEFETFEEADDFEIEDDPSDPLTPYEAVFDPRSPKPPVPAQGAPQAPAADPGGAGGPPPAQSSSPAVGPGSGSTST